MNYYIADGATQRGPFTIQQLASMGLRSDVLVWREGMSQWQPAGSVSELASLLMPPQPLPPAGTYSPPAAHPAPGASPAPVGYATPQYAPASGTSDNNKIAAGVCGILLGGFGVHKFILGLTGGAVTMLCITLAGMLAGLGCACAFPPLALLLLGPTVMHVIGLIEGIIYLSKSDQEFYQTYIVQKRQWF